LYKVEPRICVLARNLLSSDDCRAALFDEVEEGRPKVPLVSKPSALTCRAERLARAAAGPDWPIVGPSCAAQGERPSADPGEEMALRESGEFVGSYILNAPCVYNAVCNQAGLDEFAQPGRSERVNLVVIGCHGPFLNVL
jgi:hypothetical protein